MNEFVEKFNEFRDFLNSKVTEHLIATMVGENGKSTLNLIKSKFDELGLNNCF